MSESPVERARLRLLALRERYDGVPLLKAEIMKVVADLDEFRLSVSPEQFEKWRLTHAPKWNPSLRDTRVMRFWIAKGEADCNDVASLMSSDDDEPASNDAVRAYISRLRTSLEQVKATAIVLPAKRDGVYRTHDPFFQRLR